MTSVIVSPSFHNLYSDPGVINDIPNIVTNNVTAYKDINGTALPLILGASGNMVIESVHDIKSYMGTSNAYSLYTAEYDDVTKMRTDTEIFKVWTQSNSTYMTTPSNVVISPLDPSVSTIQLGSVNVSQDSSQQIFSTSQNNFMFAQGVSVSGDVAVGANLYTTGNIYGANVNVWADKSDRAYSRVGYGLRINSNDQLEIVKYSKFADKDVLKRVAIFGHNSFNSNDSSDASSNYLVFNALGSVSVASDGGSLNAIGSTSASSGNNMTLSGTTTLSGNIVPSADSYSIGSSNMFLKTLYTSNLVFAGETLVNGTPLLIDSYTSSSTTRAPTAAALSNASCAFCACCFARASCCFDRSLWY